MNGPSEDARYLASWLALRQEELILCGDSSMCQPILDEELLVELIDEYFNSRL